MIMSANVMYYVYLYMGQVPELKLMVTDNRFRFRLKSDVS